MLKIKTNDRGVCTLALNRPKCHNALNAAQALNLGLVHIVVTKDKLETSVETQTRHLLKAGPEAIKASKQLIPCPADEQIETELTALIAKLRASPEDQEGLAAFLEKRKPSWAKE